MCSSLAVCFACVVRAHFLRMGALVTLTARPCPALSCWPPLFCFVVHHEGDVLLLLHYSYSDQWCSTRIGFDFSVDSPVGSIPDALRERLIGNQKIRLYLQFNFKIEDIQAWASISKACRVGKTKISCFWWGQNHMHKFGSRRKKKEEKIQK